MIKKFKHFIEEKRSIIEHMRFKERKPLREIGELINKKVTIVIAAYNRPDTLRVAIESVFKQTFSDWQLLIIGDKCNNEVGEVIQSFSDKRIKYINLPSQFGEQSGPNSIGMALADSKYVAFLNHDDVFLDDHLEYAVNHLEINKAEFFIGLAAHSRTRKVKGEEESNIIKPVFTNTNPKNRKIHMCFDYMNGLFEPCSSWVVTKDACNKIGYWSSILTINRTSLQDWLVRAWGKRTKFVFGDKLTVLKINRDKTKNINKNKAKGSYYLIDQRYKYISKMVTKYSGEEIRRKIIQEIINQEALSNKLGANHVVMGYNHVSKYVNTKTNSLIKKILCLILINRFTKLLFFYTNYDSFTIASFFINELSHKACMKKACLIRTGENRIQSHNIDHMLESINLESINDREK